MTSWNDAKTAATIERTSTDRSVSRGLRLVVIVGALLTAMGAVVALVYPAMLVSPHEQMNGAVHVYAGYMAARNLAIAIMLLALLFIGARRALGNLMALVGLIQLLDTCMDLVEARWTVAPGVLVFGVVFLFAAARLSGHPFWSAKAWRQ